MVRPRCRSTPRGGRNCSRSAHRPGRSSPAVLVRGSSVDEAGAAVLDHQVNGHGQRLVGLGRRTAPPFVLSSDAGDRAVKGGDPRPGGLSSGCDGDGTGVALEIARRPGTALGSRPERRTGSPASVMASAAPIQMRRGLIVHPHPFAHLGREARVIAPRRTPPGPPGAAARDLRLAWLGPSDRRRGPG